MNTTMDLKVKPVNLFVGNYGSGKTEVSVNLALALAESGSTVEMADLDVVNPYFRSREVRHLLEKQNIRTVLPDDGLLNADLPIVVPGIRGLIQRPRGVAILDVGGDDVGATILGSLRDVLLAADHDMLQVVNGYRPFTDTVEGTVAITREIEAAARLSVTGVVGNPHLMEETTLDTILNGYAFTCDVAQELGLPVLFITCPEALIDALSPDAVACPVLPIRQRLLPPWKRRQALGPKKFLLS